MGSGSARLALALVGLGSAVTVASSCELVGGLDTKVLAVSDGTTSASASTSSSGGTGGADACPKEAFPDSTPLCSDGAKLVPCDDPTAVPGQDGLHVGPQQTFEFEDPNGEWVRDSVTQLVWRNGALPFQTDSCPIVNGVQSEQPALFYLLSLVDFGYAPRASPYFMTTDTFVTSALHTGVPTSISFEDGRLVEVPPPDVKLRCVVGTIGDAPIPDNRPLVPDAESPPTAFFDPETQLTWSAAYAEVNTWKKAVEYCASQPAPSDGCGAWRLPTVKELLTVMNLEGYMNVAFFGPGDDDHNPQKRKYWSSSFVASKPTDVWAVHYGKFGSDSNNTFVPYGSIQPTMVARCVR